MRDAAQAPSTATSLQKLAERFSKGALPSDMWADLTCALLYSFHKKLPKERITRTYHALRMVMVGSVLNRFECKVMARMDMITIKKQLMLSH
jgi:hypothetical protein